MRFPSKEELARELFGISTKIVGLTEQNIKDKEFNNIEIMSSSLGYVLEAVKALRGECVIHPFMDSISMPMDYLIELRDNEERKKSRCFIEYVYDLDVGEDNGINFYSQSWGVCNDLAEIWIKEFDNEIVKYDMSKSDN